MKKIISLILILSITNLQAATIQFDILTLNTALLAITADVPSLGTVKVPVLGKVKVPALGTVKVEEVGKLKHNKERAKRIADKIKELSKQGKAPSIMTVQEAFDVPVVKGELEESFKKAGIFPFDHLDKRSGRISLTLKEAFDIPVVKDVLEKPLKKVGISLDRIDLGIKLPIGANSGLAIFSEYRIKRTLQKDYTCFVGEGAFSRKGLLGAELDINGQTVYVFTTHLQAGVGQPIFKWFEDNKLLAKKKDACILDGQVIDLTKRSLTTGEVRRAQLEQAKKWMQEFAIDKNAPIIFAGDFNTKWKDDKPGADITKVFPDAQILYNESKSAPNTGTVWDVENKKVEQDNRIDYMLIVRNPGNRLKGDAWIVDWFGPQHTDHLGYLGEFELETMP